MAISGMYMRKMSLKKYFMKKFGISEFLHKASNYYEKENAI